MECDFNCFECKFSDCILDFECGNFLEQEIISGQEVDDILFEKQSADSIVVPDYRLYPFIPSEDIPYNPKWKSQAKWREYYRSRARGNRKEKIAAKAREYRYTHSDICKAREKKYYIEHHEELIAYGKDYREKHREENKIRCAENYALNREKRLAYQREYYKNNSVYHKEYSQKYYQEHKDVLLAYAKEYYKKNREKISAYQKEYHARKKKEKKGDAT